eukprot:TRINITY_DN27543_c0_g1_i3.p1 TRINITY_DN27543_c0_g1~~TRINITY_DN27543_c0_g1_i3.p1  ORF type:complete len:150 (-),score=10.32 TRINITY_DN27543_c0_g1_i3:460-909(-)
MSRNENNRQVTLFDHLASGGLIDGCLRQDHAKHPLQLVDSLDSCLQHHQSVLPFQVELKHHHRVACLSSIHHQQYPIIYPCLALLPCSLRKYTCAVDLMEYMVFPFFFLFCSLFCSLSVLAFHIRSSSETDESNREGLRERGRAGDSRE